MRWYICFLLSIVSALHAEAPTKLKVLHLTFHTGCAREVEQIATYVNLDLTTWNVLELPDQFFDGTSSGNNLYNIDHARAQRIWERHKDFFQSFDAIITSDTAVLSRIFLQNNAKIPLIIWISNRFDFVCEPDLDCAFPDPEYYELFRTAKHRPNTYVVANTAYEKFHAALKNVDIGDRLIKPSGIMELYSLPERDKKDLFYLPHYFNEEQGFFVEQVLKHRNVQAVCLRHKGFSDLRSYKAIIHLPYAWSTIALFENIGLGMPIFIPSIPFLMDMDASGRYWHQNSTEFKHNLNHKMSEWYSDENKECFIYFDSWDDLVHKLHTVDLEAQRKKVLTFARKHQATMIFRWTQIFDEIEKAKYSL